MSRSFPVPPSDVIAGIEWLGETVPYPEPGVKGDTFPVTWADDGELYTSAGDPLWPENPDGSRGCPHTSGLDVQRLSGRAPEFEVAKVNLMADYVGWGGEGPKPCGMVSVGGVLYLAFQNMLGKKPPAHGEKCQHGSDAHIVASTDHGKCWRPALREIAGPMFPGSDFGGPSFVQYGRDAENAREGRVYAVSGDQWDNGSDLRAGRVPADAIADRSAWEFVAGVAPSGEAEWTADLDEAGVVLSDDRHLSLPEMVYVAPLGRYLLFTWALFEDFHHAGSELTVYDAPEPWGPFTLSHHEPVWETVEATPYCPRMPLKWFRPDELSGWLLFSGSWAQGSPHYRANVRPFRLVTRG